MNFTARQSEVIRLAEQVFNARGSLDTQMDAAQAVLGLIFSAEDASTVVEWADAAGAHILEAVRESLAAGQVRFLGPERCGHGEIWSECEATH